jgi:hypothetical protein
MESFPLFREVCLLIQRMEDVQYAVGILSGRLTVSQVADLKGQDLASFDGDGDVLILSYTKDLASATEEEAEVVLGRSKGDDVMNEYILPALKSSTVGLEIVIRCCNLSTKSVFAVADAIRQNRYLIGFTVLGNPGNGKRGDAELKSACVETLAPIQYFQGEFLSGSILRARKARLAQKAEDEHKVDDGDDLYHSPTIAYPAFRLSVPQAESDEESDQFPAGWKNSKRVTSAASSPTSSIGNEREQWLVQMKERLRSTTEDEAEVERMLDNLELFELGKKLESLLAVGS